MGRPVFDYVGNLDTLLAVIVGAVLATGGAIVADIIREWTGRNRRQRDAARFFGEVLVSVDRVLDVALSSQAIGDRWGSVTRRLFKAAREEAGIYERNRERLFEIQDVGLRFRIHEHFLRKFIAIVAVLDYCAEIVAIEEKLAREDGLLEDRKRVLDAELIARRETREAALASVLEERTRTRSITLQLEKFAKVRFDSADYLPTGQLPLRTPDKTAET